MQTDWQRWIVTLSSTVVGIIVIAVLYWARALFMPIAVAVFFTFVLSPLVAWLQHRGIGRTLSVLVVSLVVICVAAGVGAVIAHEIVGIANTLPDRKEAIEHKLVEVRQWLFGSSRFGNFLDDMREVLFPKPQNRQTVVVESPSGPMASQFQEYISPSIEFLGQAALTALLTVYMLIRREDLRNRMIRLVGAGRVTTTTKAVDEASRRVSRYLLVQLCVNVSFGTIIAIGLLALEVKYVLLWGFLAGVMRYVPYIGTWIGVIFPLLFSFATAPAWWGGWGQPLMVFVMYVGLELIVANALEPWLYGSSMGLSSVAQVLAASFWAYMWGPIGLVLSGPLTACLLVLGKYVRGAEFLEVLLGDEPALAPPIALYQRLAARDQDEASEVALAVAREKGPDVALETVIVPALAMIRRDRDRGEIEPTAFRYAIHGAREIAAEVAELREQTTTTSDSRVRMLICPARDEAEHVAAEVLGSLLDASKWEVRVAGDETLASELVKAVEDFQPAAVVLIALLPGGASHCRYLVKRLRAKFGEDVRILIGRWGASDSSRDEESGGVRLADAEDRSLTSTFSRMAALHPVLLADIEKRHAVEKDPVEGAGRSSSKQDPLLAHAHK